MANLVNIISSLWQVDPKPLRVDVLKLFSRMVVRLFFAFNNLVYLSFYLDSVGRKSDFTEGHQKPPKNTVFRPFLTPKSAKICVKPVEKLQKSVYNLLH